MNNRKLHIVLLSLLFIALYSCSPAPRFTSGRDRPPPEPPRGGATEEKPAPNYDEYKNVSVLETQIGLASYYAHKYHGRTTSNGEIYDMYGLTAAHPDYPAGTIIRVTKLSSNKSITIRINDHMPDHPERIIDLSYGTAKELDMIEEGITEVKVEVLEWGN